MTVEPATPDPLSSCSAPVSFSALTVVAHVDNADDVAVASDGTLWVSDPVGGVIVHLSTDRGELARITDTETPEGMVALDDGRVLLAEQATDRIVVLRPPAQTRTTFAQLTPRAGSDGVDGLGVDLVSGKLLVPDSAQARLLTIPLDGGTQTVVASGLGRVVGAAVAPDGSIALAAEASAGLILVKPASGATTVIPGINQADDVVAAGALLYVTALDLHAVLAVDPASGRSRVLVSHVSTPQGIAALPGNRLAVTDSTSGAVAVVFAC